MFDFAEAQNLGAIISLKYHTTLKMSYNITASFRRCTWVIEAIDIIWKFGTVLI
jgi:hypothetical protein